MNDPVTAAENAWLYSSAVGRTRMRDTLAAWCEAEAEKSDAGRDYERHVISGFLRQRAAALRASERQGEEGGR